MTFDTALPDWLPRPRAKPLLLVVDDQPMNVRVMHELFRDECEVLMATSGEQAVAICGAQLPDLVLLDVMMPGLDGREVCRILKQDSSTSDIPVIFVTGQRSVEDEVAGFEAGAIDFISKPINPIIVRARVHTHLALKIQRDTLRSIAFIDGLTGIPNRHSFDEALARGWRNCLREHAPLSLFMIDVDHFKRYNDRYGHQAGDNCLRAIAQALKGTLLRPYDLIARYGGEEFVCLLPHTDSAGAAEMAQRAIDTVSDLQLEHLDSDTSATVSISIGVATATPCNHLSAEMLIAAADRQLYVAKNQGRNRFGAMQLGKE